MAQIPNLMETFKTDAEWIRHEQYVAEKEAEARRHAEAEARRRALGAEYAGCTFRNYETAGNPQLRDALIKCKTYAANVKAGTAGVLVLLGSNGAGKTHLMHAIVDAVGFGCITDEFRLTEEYQQSRSFDAVEDEERFIRRVTGYRLLCIDEVGRSSRTQLARELLFRLLDNSVTNCRPLVLVTNTPRADFQSVYGSAICSRLNQRSVVVDLTGAPDHRLKRT